MGFFLNTPSIQLILLKLRITSLQLLLGIPFILASKEYIKITKTQAMFKNMQQMT